MATSTVLSNPVVTINSVDLTGNTTSVSPKIKATALAATSFGDTSTKFVAGLYDNEVSFDMYWSEAAASVYATIKALIGTTFNVTWKATSAATSATNVMETLTGCYLEEIGPVYKLGELATISITVKGGVYSSATT
jgi:hypothetical protein